MDIKNIIIFVLISAILIGWWFFRDEKKVSDFKKKVIGDKPTTEVDDDNNVDHDDIIVQEPVDYYSSRFNVSFPHEPSRDELRQLTKTYVHCGTLYSSADDEHTVFNLYRRLIMPGRDIGDEKYDTSSYRYQVRGIGDNEGLTIELPNSYSQLVEDDLVNIIPGFESLGTFIVDLFDQNYQFTMW